MLRFLYRCFRLGRFTRLQFLRRNQRAGGKEHQTNKDLSVLKLAKNAYDWFLLGAGMFRAAPDGDYLYSRRD